MKYRIKIITKDYGEVSGTFKEFDEVELSKMKEFLDSIYYDKVDFSNDGSTKIVIILESY